MLPSCHHYLTALHLSVEVCGTSGSWGKSLSLITTFFISRILDEFPWLVLLPLVVRTEGPTLEGDQSNCFLLLRCKLLGNTYAWIGRTRGYKMCFLQPLCLYNQHFFIFSRPVLGSFLALFLVSLIVLSSIERQSYTMLSVPSLL